MSKENDVKQRLARIAAGQRNLKDIEVALFWIRNHAKAESFVNELGHFVAHSEDRDRGLVTKNIKRAFSYFRIFFRMQLDQAGPRLPGARDKTDLTEDYADAVRYLVSRIDQAEAKKYLGFPKKTAERYVEKALAKLINCNGKFFYGRPATPDEQKVIGYCFSVFRGLALTTSREVFNEFILVIYKLKLVDESQRSGLIACYEYFTLHALVLMHDTNLITSINKTGRLNLKIDKEDGSMSIMYHESAREITADFIAGGGGFLAAYVFQTDLRAQNFCTQRLLDAYAPHSENSVDFSESIEINHEGKLDLIRNQN